MAEEKTSKKKVIWFIVIATFIVCALNIEEKSTQTESKPKLDKEVVVAIDDMKKNLEKTKPQRDELQNHIFSLNIGGLNKDAFSISTYDDGFEVSFDVWTTKQHIEQVGKDILKRVLNSNPPHKIMTCDIVVSNKTKSIMIGYNGESYYVIENGKSRDIEL